MTRVRTVAPVVAVLVLLPSLAAAQAPVTSFERLNTRLKGGDTVWVTDAQGREIKGRIRGLSAGSFALERDGRTEDVPAARVRTIQVQPADRLWDGVLWGLGAGVLVGAGSCLFTECIADESGPGITVMLGVVGGLVGAGIGAGVDAAIKGPKLVVYEAAPAASAARISIAPVLTPQRRGFVFSYAF